ncbi:MAG: DUF6125 family protein [Acidobacteriota bacterium]|jgi:hypothetical protein
MTQPTGKTLPAEKLVELLGKMLLAWDGQWFLKVAESCGLETAVELNARVRESEARIEMRELMKALGLKEAAGLEEAMEVIQFYGRDVFSGVVQADYRAEGGALTVDVCRCRPQEGASKAGLKPDTPCIACARLWNAWLGTLIPHSQWETDIRESLGRGASHCLIQIRKSAGKSAEPGNRP